MDISSGNIKNETHINDCWTLHKGCLIVTSGSDGGLHQDAARSVKVHHESVGSRVELRITDEVLYGTGRYLTVTGVKGEAVTTVVGKVGIGAFSCRVFCDYFAVTRTNIQVDVVYVFVHEFFTVPDPDLLANHIGNGHLLTQQPVGAVEYGDITVANDVVQSKVGNPTVLVTTPDEFTNVISHLTQSGRRGEHMGPYHEITGLLTE
ncbi:pre translocase subunit, putative [Babesia ovis]|uniref:Pre translocase subunit, putative n=1 Tax=Babesia ovis TaxID=5869 RepID=A0A9W5TA96_BABOV|nr:pre translocase subunit, putative [Babesia ovis]